MSLLQSSCEDNGAICSTCEIFAGDACPHPATAHHGPGSLILVALAENYLFGGRVDLTDNGRPYISIIPRSNRTDTLVQGELGGSAYNGNNTRTHLLPDVSFQAASSQAVQTASSGPFSTSLAS